VCPKTTISTSKGAISEEEEGNEEEANAEEDNARDINTTS
jgi:hypothetical protein